MNKSKLLNYLYYYIIKIKKILRLSTTKSALSTLILIIPLLYELFNDIAIEYKISLVLIVALINIYLVRNEIRKPDIRIEELLEMMIKTISRGDRKALGEYRANIMIYPTFRINTTIP